MSDFSAIMVNRKCKHSLLHLKLDKKESNRVMIQRKYRYEQLGMECMEVGEKNNSQIKSGAKNLLMLELLYQHFDNLEEEFKKYEDAIKNNRYPLKIRVTQLVEDCAQGVYYNDGNVENDVCEIVDSIFILVCNAKFGSNFYAKRVCVGKHLYYEVYQVKG